MKKEYMIVGGGAILAVAIIIYFLIEKRIREEELIKTKERETKLGQENKALRNIVSELKEEVNKIIDKKDELSEDVKKQLKSLIAEYKDIDEKVTNELLSVTALIEIKENTKAIMGLVKIIENLLKQIYKGDSDLKPKPVFKDLIEHAKKKKLIEKDEYHFLNGLREVRNYEAHDLAVQKEINIISSSYLIGFSIILKLAGIIKEKIKKKEPAAT